MCGYCLKSSRQRHLHANHEMATPALFAIPCKEMVQSNGSGSSFVKLDKINKKKVSKKKILRK